MGRYSNVHFKPVSTDEPEKGYSPFLSSHSITVTNIQEKNGDFCSFIPDILIHCGDIFALSSLLGMLLGRLPVNMFFVVIPLGISMMIDSIIRIENWYQVSKFPPPYRGHTTEFSILMFNATFYIMLIKIYLLTRYAFIYQEIWNSVPNSPFFVQLDHPNVASRSHMFPAYLDSLDYVLFVMVYIYEWFHQYVIAGSREIFPRDPDFYMSLHDSLALYIYLHFLRCLFSIDHVGFFKSFLGSFLWVLFYIAFARFVLACCCYTKVTPGYFTEGDARMNMKLYQKYQEVVTPLVIYVVMIVIVSIQYYNRTVAFIILVCTLILERIISCVFNFLHTKDFYDTFQYSRYLLCCKRFERPAIFPLSGALDPPPVDNLFDDGDEDDGGDDVAGGGGGGGGGGGDVDYLPWGCNVWTCFYYCCRGYC